MKRDSTEYVQILNSYFPHPSPAHTMVEVSNLAIEGMLLEVDAVAVL
jgi:enamine deaminase RidA (YjgF/YER057c/UK114 family)